ncbi:MAG TPA: lytic transglycosylase domain-containing protein [Burkholderiales bacterium]|nr:lytic transglycosylase domain-containing protein [Burkholderiales bacterium]
MRSFRWWLLWVLFAATPEVLGARLEIPLRVPLELVSIPLGEVYREGPCRHVTLDAPKIEAVGENLKLTSPGTGAIGVELLGKCQTAGDWRGTLEVTLKPGIDAAGVLRVRIVDSKLTDDRGSASPVPLLWELGKPQIHSRIERFGYDLGASREALIGMLRGAAPPEQGAAMEAMLRQIEVGTPRVEKTHVLVPVAMEVADAWLAPPPPAATSTAPLTEAEMEALEEALAPWDAFLAYAIRQIARDGKDPALRQRLFTLLLDSRYRLSEVLSGDVVATGDPARALFIETFNELRAILADTTRYTLFIDAGDALVALENAAPGLGMRLSADGLRQLARSLQPGEKGDPLALDWAVDPELRELFDVQEVREPAPRPRSSLDFFIKVAQEKQKAPDPEEIKRWLPKGDELADYQKEVGAVLAGAAAGELQRTQLPAPHAKTYAYLIPTTALIESCWKHYVVRGGKATFLRSQSSSVGIMQINQRVWRGFYDVHRLRWDPAYNIEAGAQILMRYVKDYAIPYATKTGNPQHVPRAAYAVYNAGPRAVGRFAKQPPHPREARVDEKLWTLYQGISSGGQVDLKTCGIRDPG